jgi:regulatory protein
MSEETSSSSNIGDRVYDKAVQLLSMRMHTTGELHQKLQKRGFKDEDIRPVLHRLEELKFLDDEKFAQIFVDNFKRYKDFGYFGIKTKLMQRRVPSDIIEKALAEFFSPDDERAVALRLIKKLKKTGRTKYDQLARSLQSRGFRSAVVGALLSDRT